MKPFKGYAQPSDRTWTHCRSRAVMLTWGSSNASCLAPANLFSSTNNSSTRRSPFMHFGIMPWRTTSIIREMASFGLKGYMFNEQLSHLAHALFDAAVDRLHHHVGTLGLLVRLIQTSKSYKYTKLITETAKNSQNLKFTFKTNFNKSLEPNLFKGKF